MEQDRFSAETN